MVNCKKLLSLNQLTKSILLGGNEMSDQKKDSKPIREPLTKPGSKEPIPRRESEPVEPIPSRPNRLHLVDNWDTSSWMPYAVDVLLLSPGDKERVLVSNVGSKIVVFNLKGQNLTKWTVPNSGGIGGIRGLKVDNRTADGRIYVIMNSSRWIHVLNRDGTIHSSWQGVVPGGTQYGGTGIIHPNGIVVLPDGSLIIACDEGGSLNYFTPDGVFIKAIGSKGSSWGELNGPNQLAYDDQNGVIYVVERHVHRISVFNHLGECLQILGGFGSAEGQFNAPNGIVLDKSKDVVFVSDTNNNRIQVLKTDGSFLTAWSDDDLDNLMEPRNMAIGSDGRLYVTCPPTKKVKVFEYRP